MRQLTVLVRFGVAWSADVRVHRRAAPRAGALESGGSQAEKPPPAAGGFEFTSPKSAIQPVPECHETHAQTLLQPVQMGNTTMHLQNTTRLTLRSVGLALA
ncbi:hypothetical protein EYF80_048311 [Liparis tanakae]|uniref:Uncharacterized protein n=1 Tax=Liparis tanakae TaxID=230148 RepID=A0A4Z2FKV4_9TELE|nr:hypothetical protein EYF80_048311 [Liparis tanakae]